MQYGTFKSHSYHFHPIENRKNEREKKNCVCVCHIRDTIIILNYIVLGFVFGSLQINTVGIRIEKSKWTEEQWVSASKMKWKIGFQARKKNPQRRRNCGKWQKNKMDRINSAKPQSNSMNSSWKIVLWNTCAFLLLLVFFFCHSFLTVLPEFTFWIFFSFIFVVCACVCTAVRTRVILVAFQMNSIRSRVLFSLAHTLTHMHTKIDQWRWNKPCDCLVVFWSVLCKILLLEHQVF